MHENLLARTVEIFTTRLQTLGRLLQLAEGQLQEKQRDPEALLAARLAEDMLPLPHQIVFACNQPNAFAAWCTDGTPAQTDPTKLDFAGLRRHVEETIRHLGDAMAKVDGGVLGREKHIKLRDGMAIDLPGDLYIDDWLMPNFYFHIVTAYDILRHEGVQIGKADYMAHLASRLRPAEQAQGANA